MNDDVRRLLALERAFEALGCAIAAAARARGDLRSIGGDALPAFGAVIEGIEKLAVGQTMISTEIGSAVELRDALLKLHPLDLKRFQDGYFIRADGGAICARCGLTMRAHPPVPGLEFPIVRRCDGEFVKL